METSDFMSRTPHALAAASRSLDPSIGTVVCIPCFRRPQHLRLTLESLANQRTDRRFAVVIVENDAFGCASSVPVAAEFLASGRFPGLCVVEPRQGNCHAINAAFETALATFPDCRQFSDDRRRRDCLDRLAGAMVRAAEATGADLVGGPVLPNFDDDMKRGLRRHPAFRPAYDRSGPVPVIYGCGNCLITRPVFAGLGDPAFDLRFNFLGGGDTDFFVRCRRAGMKFHWAAEAVITETVPRSRTNPGLAGAARPAHRRDQLSRPAQGGADAVVAGEAARQDAGDAAAVAVSCRPARCSAEHKALIALHPMIVAVGSALAAIGIEPQPYKASKIVS